MFHTLHQHPYPFAFLHIFLPHLRIMKNTSFPGWSIHIHSDQYDLLHTTKLLCPYLCLMHKCRGICFT